MSEWGERKKTPFLLQISRRNTEWSENAFPFSIPVLKSFEALALTSPITIFVGENGSGKSTFLEGIAAGLQKIAIGSSAIQSDPSLDPARKLGEELRFGWKQKTARGFFLRAEDFFGYAKSLQNLGVELQAMEDEFDQSFEGYGRQLAVGTVKGQREAIEKRYGGDLDQYSHGESFLKLFQERLVPHGLYLLDEPETPLSPMRQLSLLSLMREAVAAGSQFIMATHSPILMACPGAEILSFENGEIVAAEYDELEHVTLTRSFLNNPERFLRQL